MAKSSGGAVARAKTRVVKSNPRRTKKESRYFEDERLTSGRSIPKPRKPRRR